jgi:hypothetical protein
MLPTLVLAVTLAPAVDPTGPKAYPPAYIPAEAPHGYLYRPVIDVRAIPRPPAVAYTPQAGDILLCSDPSPLFTFFFRIALTGKPAHCALVVTMPDGRLGALEAGFGFTPWTRLTPLDYQMSAYSGSIWVRPRLEPITPEQDRRLTEFAMTANNDRYAIWKYLGQLTPLRMRGPLRTRFVGKPSGPGHRFICGEIVMEALVYAALTDTTTARPLATYAQDLFYDRARNPYIDRHPPLAGRGWGEPQLWTPIPGTARPGRDRPQPPSPWPGVGGAYVVYPLPTGDKQPPTPVVVGYVPGELRPIAPVEYRSQRVGFFDRPYRLLIRRR